MLNKARRSETKLNNNSNIKRNEKRNEDRKTLNGKRTRTRPYLKGRLSFSIVYRLIDAHFRFD